jgi:diguanylate cyclase (GGDEF)-like protein
MGLLKVDLGLPQATARTAALAQQLRQVDAMRALDLDQICSFLRKGTLIEIGEGEVLLREGDLNTGEIFILIEGALRIESNGVPLLNLTNAGDVVGELGALQGLPRMADVVALRPSSLVAARLDLLVLPGLAPAVEALYVLLSKGLASKLRETTEGSLRQIDRVVQEAAIDTLTGLANRKRLEEFLAKAEARAAQVGEPFALIIADVDHFKKFNDAYGHQSGDQALARVGHILAEHVRKSDLAARYGGEEFVVVLPGCRLPEAAVIAEKLRHAVEQEVFEGLDGDRLVRLTATFGVADYHNGTSAQAVLRRADESLYKGKAAGRNRVVCAAPVPAA